MVPNISRTSADTRDASIKNLKKEALSLSGY
jgi:hypothetical protein